MNKKAMALAILAGVLIVGIVIIVVLCLTFPSFKQTLLELIGAVKGTTPPTTPNITNIST